MCGIVGAVAQRDVAEILLMGLQRLEYRGYDSAGLAVADGEQLHRLRRLGKVEELASALEHQPVSGGTGIAHTRWATHGAPSEANAHPHVSHERFAIVHNGIIENHQALRERLEQSGYTFSSETDTEVIVHLIHQHVQGGESLFVAVRQVVSLLEGAYGMVVLDKMCPEELIVARSGSPLVIGKGIGEHFIASDQLALLPVTRQFLFLEEGDVARVTRRDVNIVDSDGHEVVREWSESDVVHDAGELAGYRHFMQKEIFEQPKAILDTIAGRVDRQSVHLNSLGEEALAVLRQVEFVQIVACGTSYHAGLVARYWLEGLAGIRCNVEIASEYRYRRSVASKNGLLITISQSGETADTLAALRLAKEQGFLSTLTICNVPGSSLVRESDIALMTRAGAEIGVASTKAFTTQLAALLTLVGELAGDASIKTRIAEGLSGLSDACQKVLALDEPIKALASEFADKEHSLFLGRGEQYPIAMEGALKLKEISYIHAEAYAAGELKHGPLALIDEDMPIIVVAPNNDLLEKLKSNVEEVKARGGILYVFSDADNHFTASDTMRVIDLPHVEDIIAPIVYTLPLQLLSYHVALIKGTDVDKPRNLAKSVTVE